MCVCDQLVCALFPFKKKFTIFCIIVNLYLSKLEKLIIVISTTTT